MKYAKMAIVALVMISVAGCIQGIGPKQGIGTAAGAVGGGLLGSQVGKGKGRLVATALGALIGAWAGGTIGSQLDQRDRMLAARTLNVGLETGRSSVPVSWKNPDSGNHGYFVPQKAYTANRRVCRRYKSAIYIGNKLQNGVGTACRRANGSWELMS